MRAVLGKERHPIRGQVVQSMRISIAGHEIEAVIVATSQGGLQTVVRRSIESREVVNQCEGRGLAVEVVGATGQLPPTGATGQVVIVAPVGTAPRPKRVGVFWRFC